MSSEKVEFQTADGVNLRGDLYRTSIQDAPIVVLAPGLFLLKESFNGPIALRLQEAGYNALIYDHPGWGNSDPSTFSSPSTAAKSFPRQEYNPAEQARDIHDAVKYAKSLDGVDRDRLILWGTGHGGGASFIAASEDENVEAVIGAFPWFSRKQNVQYFPDGLLEAAEAEHNAAAKDPSYVLKYQEIWNDSLGEAKGARRWIFAHGKGPFTLLEEARRLAKDAGTPWKKDHAEVVSFSYQY